MAISQKPLTLEEFLQLPEAEPALEFEDGRVIQKVPPTGRHSRLQAKLSDLINRFGESRKIALAFPELRTTFAGRSYVPDIAVYRWDRIPVTAEGDVADDFPEPPDIAVEVVSPQQSANALFRRCLWYVANGVRVALLVDPSDTSVLVFRSDEMPKALRGSDRIDLGEVLPGFELTVEELFAALRVR